MAKALRVILKCLIRKLSKTLRAPNIYRYFVRNTPEAPPGNA